MRLPVDTSVVHFVSASWFDLLSSPLTSSRPPPLRGRGPRPIGCPDEVRGPKRGDQATDAEYQKAQW
jgi:hypothetical protein